MWEGGGLLAESNITKRALAVALKVLVESRPFSKISIGDICEQCAISRKSFYYHFKDKYDLVNWIYYTEFIAAAEQKKYALGWDFLEDLCVYFYNNHDFYRKTLNVAGQNSFSEYFRSVVMMIITNIMETIYSKDDPIDFYVGFYTDAFYCAIKKWMLDRECIAADAFVRQLKACLFGTSVKIVEGLSE